MAGICTKAARLLTCKAGLPIDKTTAAWYTDVC